MDIQVHRVVYDESRKQVPRPLLNLARVPTGTPVRFSEPGRLLDVPEIHRSSQHSISSFYGNLSPGELESLFVALRDRCDPPSFEAAYFTVHHFLDAIDITPIYYDNHDANLEKSIDHPPFIIPSRVLTPFLRLCLLKSIVLSLHLLGTDDDEIEEIAAHSPMLHRFDLATDSHGLISRSRITLRSILSFVAHCRHLFQDSLLETLL